MTKNTAPMWALLFVLVTFLLFSIFGWQFAWGIMMLILVCSPVIFGIVALVALFISHLLKIRRIEKSSDEAEE